MKKHLPKKHWDESKKVELIQTYVLIGNLRVAAATLGIPEVTARVWKASQYWKDTEDEIRRGRKVKLSNRINTIVEKALETLDDRLTNGDPIPHKTYVMKDGKSEVVWEIRHVPVPARDVNKIATQLIDRTLVIEKSTQVEKDTDEGLEARLDKLKREMIEKFSRKQIIKGDIIDVVPIESVQQSEGSIPESPSFESIPAPTSASDGPPADPASNGDGPGIDLSTGSHTSL